MKLLGIAAVTLLVSATGALAAAPPPDQTAQPAKDKRVCKTEKITGSLTRVRRTCMTQAEWDRLAEGSRDNVNDIVRDASRAATPGN